jgi:LytR cell envelope-related transcriptional attenuator
VKKTAQKNNKSLKTFFLYIAIVVVLVIVSLAIKGFFLIQESKVDPSHHFTLAVLHQNSVKEIVSFQPETPSVTTLVIKNSNISYYLLAKEYGIETDGYIQAVGNISPDATIFLWESIIHSALWKSNLTLFDKIRLFFLAKNVTANNKTTESVTLANQNSAQDPVILNALSDQDIANENVSIEIINATNVTGFGQRLARVLTNSGANVVAIETAEQTQKKSTITYFGNESYTLNFVQKLLGIKARTFARQRIADIVITLGYDKINTAAF